MAGVLAAAMIMPIVATSGVLVRNEADKFTTLSLDTQSLPQRSEILDNSGHLLSYVYGVDVPYYSSSSAATALQYFGWDRQPVTYSQIDSNMTNAIVAIEDSRYWVHGALDLRGTFRAALNDIQHKPVQGGSTIAQQYVKNVLLLSAEMAGNSQAEVAAYADTLSRKLNELRLAVGAEHQLTKQDILAGYLNDAYFGNNAYGIETAAETYFGTTVGKLTVTQAATLAGIVENPSKYNPIQNPGTALERRNTVLARMAQTGIGLTAAQAKVDEAKPLGLSVSTPQSGCTASSVGSAGFFCEYVEEVVLHDAAYGKTPMARAKLLATGGLQIHTTLDPQDQQAAVNAVSYVEPGGSSYYNPGHNADTEAVVQPGTGQIKAIAENTPYGTGRGQTEIDYAVNSAYGGSDQGVQTGSSSKLFTLITALKQNIPFGFQMSVPGSTTVDGYTNCQGAPAGNYNGAPGAYNVTNAEGPQSASTQSLYTATTQSVNVFYAELEQKVGLCNVVNTAASLGLTRVDGTSILSNDKTPSGTLAVRGQHSVLHPGLGRRRAAVDGGGLRHGRRPGRLLRTGRHRKDRHGHWRLAGGTVGELPPGALLRRGRCRQLHPAGRADHRYGGLSGRPGWPRSGRQDRYLQRGERLRHPVRRLRRLHAQPGRLRLGVQPGLAHRPRHDGRDISLLPAGVRQRGVPG